MEIYNCSVESMFKFSRNKIHLHNMKDLSLSQHHSDVAGLLQNLGRHPAGTRPKTAERRGRVAVFPGCAQQVLEPEINAATIRLLTRLGYDVEVVSAPCCGALTHHMGKSDQAESTATRMIDAVLAADSAGPS